VVTTPRPLHHSTGHDPVQISEASSHLTLKLETTKPAGQNFLQQQARFDDFIDTYKRASQHPSVYVIEENRLC
jgi:putative transposase